MTDIQLMSHIEQMDALRVDFARLWAPKLEELERKRVSEALIVALHVRYWNQYREATPEQRANWKW